MDCCQLVGQSSLEYITSSGRGGRRPSAGVYYSVTEHRRRRHVQSSYAATAAAAAADAAAGRGTVPDAWRRLRDVKHSI